MQVMKEDMIKELTSEFDEISMSGRMAYVIMCVEAFLEEMYPEKDWTIVAEAMWKATEMNRGDWPEIYAGYIPSVFFSYEEYGSDLVDSYPRETYDILRDLFDGITSGIEDDSEDLLNYMLDKPHEMAMVYEGTGIGDGKESIEIIRAAEKVLTDHDIPLPDYHKVVFSAYGERRGWGDSFNGRFLSVILRER